MKDEKATVSRMLGLSDADESAETADSPLRVAARALLSAVKSGDEEGVEEALEAAVNAVTQAAPDGAER